MRMVIEIESKSELEKLSALFKTFNTVKVISADEPKIPIVRGNKKLDPTALFNIWEKNPRSLEDIREYAWKRNQ
ncbi:hypothetical protein [Mucilaginibacter auburnensis]|nr:hypothetical protein [Mucilaginibacter auburnensis]